MLLLDDVLSELDGKRQSFVLNRIQGGQVFITCCEEEKLEGLDGQVFLDEDDDDLELEVEEGSLELIPGEAGGLELEPLADEPAPQETL